MYPRLSDLIYDLTGYFPCLPIQTYGFFLALGFVAAGMILYAEFRRMERAGLMQGVNVSRIVGTPATASELIVNGIIGFLLGYKIVAAAMDWKYFADNPQDFIVSPEGSIVGGIVLAVVLVGLRWYEKKKDQLPVPQTIEETIFPHQRIGDLIVIAAIAGILGSKVFTWMEDWENFMRDPIGALLSFSGLMFYGGLICGSIALIVYAKMVKIPIWRMTDAAGMAVIVGYGIGRLGCHFAGDGDWGIANTLTRPNWLSWLPDWAWAYTYPHNVINEGIALVNCSMPCCVDIPGCATRYCKVLPEGVFPTSVYEFLMAMAIFGVLWLLRKRISTAGILFGIFLILNGIERFLIEFVRINDRHTILGIELSFSQYIALGLVALGIGVVGTRKMMHNADMKN
ncbi:MAG: prolipoprotein diacylglyceryl transferase [Chitinophagales bacterium]